MAIDSVINSMRTSLQEALDDMASPRVSSNGKLKALQMIERHLAEACFNEANDFEAKDCFVALQHTFECNVASRLLPWISMTSTKLDNLSSKSVTDNDQSQEVGLLSSSLALSLSLIQGTVLTHPPTKHYLGRRSALEVLLDLLLTSRHLAPLSEKTDSSSKTSKETTHLTSIVLDTLLCILVDSSSALRVFEAAHGVQAIVKILKRAGTPREVRMKCLEFIYFYLLDETPSNSALTFTPATPASATAPTTPNSVPTAPTTSTALAPATPIRPPKPYFAATGNPLRPTSRYGSSTFSFSGSNKTLSVSISSASLSPSSSLPSSRSSSGSSNQSFCSTSSNASSGTDLSSVPASPVKESFSSSSSQPQPNGQQHLPAPPRSPIKRVATPANIHVRPNADAPTSKGPFSSAARYPQMKSMMLLRREVEYEPESPKKAPESSGTSTANSNSNISASTSRPATPLNRHKRSLSSLSSSSSSSAIGPTSSATRKTHTRSRSQITLSEATADASKSPTSPGSVPMPHDAMEKIRALQQEQYGQRQQKEKEKAEAEGGRKEKDASLSLWKTTEEKKELLGTMLGNVDALVEGVRKAGVWGLA
ncbi:hypothetical protein D9619_000719 [Psilocybe cf. subviscida]|uniref:Cell division control protein 14 n=1 Tax=Psilocybe cf. subviscida TaxID=2480587 RepID=A0A8H5BF50_9AGAR|nr:hypothetical protein D9619_000719 [Psilocybe cf. subviscida]